MELSRVRGPCRQCRAAPHRVRPRDAAALAGPCPVENGRLAHRAQVAAGILEIACDRSLSIPHIWSYGRASLIFQPIEDRWRRKNFRSEEHTSELQSLMRISYAVF